VVVWCTEEVQEQRRGGLLKAVGETDFC